MFWGIILESGKRYSQVVEETYHLTMAALEPDQKKKGKAVSVMVVQDDKEFIICNLDYERNLHQPLDLLFVEGKTVTFLCNGEGRVHLTGYLMPEEGFGGEFEDESDASSEIDDVIASKANNVGKRKLEKGSVETAKKFKEEVQNNSIKPATAEKKPNAKVEPIVKQKEADVKKKQNTPAKVIPAKDESDSEMESDEDSDSLDALTGGKGIVDLDGLGSFDEEDDDDDDDDDDLDDEEDDDDEVEVSQEKLKGLLKKNDFGKKGNKFTNDKGQQQKNQQKSPQQKPQQQTPQQKQQQNNQKNQQNQNQSNQQKKEFGKGGSPHEKGGNFKRSPFNKNKGGNNSPFNKNRGGMNTPNSAPNKESNAEKLSGGVTVKDVFVGNGPEVRKGKFLHVNYIGRLEQNNEEFDRSNKPFSFRLGAGEVIKGWEIGLEGMKVGGKRMLTVPSSMAYGNRKVGVIPANSTLKFEVELKAIS